jgi:hypothetical protein
MTDDTIAAGREAWAKLGTANSFEAWRSVALAVAIGRQQAMQAAGTNKPQGPKYGAAFNRWLEDNGFRQMPYPVRTACCRLVDNLREIELWRATVPGGERWHHPQVLVRNWRRDFAPGRGIEPRKTMMRHTVIGAKRDSHGKPINPSGDMIKRVAVALRENWSTDTFKLAVVAIRAVLGDPDLAALLNEAPPTSHTRPTVVPADAPHQAA